ncbi:ANTAR domain-containing protein [Streptomyces sp. NPDC048566]|uniref:ANTAR domain-containing protein n=1 Tax=Streptomyces sp. NPDC048566 TaxID=3365569 RepID=UPI003722F582
MTSDTDRTQYTAPPAETSADAVTRLEGENLQLQQAVRSHAVVDQAIGVVLAVGRLTPDEGWDALRAISQNTNVKLRHVAELIVGWARTGELPAEIRDELERRLGLGGTGGER